MNVAIQITYNTENGNSILQQGSFPLKRRMPEQVAMDFWKDIKREMRYGCTIEKVIADGIDITDNVKELENGPYIPEETLNEMKKFFSKTSIPRILKERFPHSKE